MCDRESEATDEELVQLTLNCSPLWKDHWVRPDTRRSFRQRGVDKFREAVEAVDPDAVHELMMALDRGAAYATKFVWSPTYGEIPRLQASAIRTIREIGLRSVSVRPLDGGKDWQERTERLRTALEEDKGPAIRILFRGLHQAVDEAARAWRLKKGIRLSLND